MGVALFGLSFFATIVAIGLAVSVSRRFLWLAALSSWLLSFLGSFSIGLYTLVITFVTLALAIGFTTGWIRGYIGELLAAASGIVSWACAVRWIDDYWLFFPLNELLSRLLG
jgi:hypothetical protein